MAALMGVFPRVEGLGHFQRTREDWEVGQDPFSFRTSPAIPLLLGPSEPARLRLEEGVL